MGFLQYGREYGTRDPIDLRAVIDNINAQHRLSDAVGLVVELKKAGKEVKGRCPFHDEKSASFYVNDIKGLYYCHACGARGDLVQWVRATQGVGTMDAIRIIDSAALPTVSIAEKGERVARDEAEKLASIEDAKGFWAAASDIYGTPAERYLRDGRGITGNLPPSMRFGMVPSRKDDAGNWCRTYPALLCAVTIGDDLVAIQRIFIKPDGSDKAWGKRSKLTLGRFRGGAVKMGNRCPDPVELVISEGPEDCLSLAQELPDQEVWCALGTANMPLLQLPPSVRRVTIAGQNDEPGRVAVNAAAEALSTRGLEVRLMWPAAPFKDFNDQLRGTV